ncbi:MAG: efflux RND transporter periplasmic adaptor subunit [Gemmatimonadales bacterium]
MISRKHWRWAAGLAVLAILIWWAVRPVPVLVDVGDVDRGPIVVAIEEDGVTEVRNRFLITAPVTGRLARPGIEAGDRVDPSTVIATISSAPLDPRTRSEANARYQAALDAERTTRALAAQADDLVAQAQREERRQQALYAQGVIAVEDRERAVLATTSRQRDADAARARSAAAAHEVDLARAALAAAGSGRIAIRAPVAGRVLRVLEESERVVPAGTVIAEIGNPGDLEIRVDLLSTDAVRLTPGDTLRLSNWGGPDTLVALVRRIAPSGETRISALGVEEQRVDVVATIAAPPPRLGDRFRVVVTVELDRVADAVRVPRAALFRNAGRWTVFVVAGGRAVERAVETGLIGTEVAEVRGGLAPGDRVVLHPDEQIADGRRIAPRAAQP